MKEFETIKEYSDILFGIVNKVRLLGTEFVDSRIIQKMLVTVHENYAASITTLENTKDMSHITLIKLLNALQAQDQRRLMRQGRIVEGALPAKYLDAEKNKKKFNKKIKLQVVITQKNSQIQSEGRNKKKIKKLSTLLILWQKRPSPYIC